MFLRLLGRPLELAGVIVGRLGNGIVMGRVMLFGLGSRTPTSRGLTTVGDFGTTVRTLPTGVSIVHGVRIKLGVGPTRT